MHDLEELVCRNPDIVFLGLKYIYDVDALTGTKSKLWVSNYLCEHGIDHTGSESFAIRLERDKSLAKAQIAQAGLQTSPHYVVRKSALIEDTVIPPLEYPLFVKPTALGGGIGIDEDSVIRSKDRLAIQISKITDNYHADVLVEEFLDGREFSVGILKKLNSQEYYVWPIELIPPLNSRLDKILCRQTKIQDREVAAALTETILRRRVCELALSSFTALDGRDYGRIDIRLDRNGIPNFLEANLIPSLIENYGSFPKACEMNAGMEYEAMILHIVNLVITRTINHDLSIMLDLDQPDVIQAIPVVVE